MDLYNYVCVYMLHLYYIKSLHFAFCLISCCFSGTNSVEASKIRVKKKYGLLRRPLPEEPPQAYNPAALVYDQSDLDSAYINMEKSVYERVSFQRKGSNRTSSYPVFATEPLCEKSSLEAVDSTSTVNQSSDTALPFPLFEPAESARNDKDTDVSNRKKASPVHAHMKGHNEKIDEERCKELACTHMYALE